MSGGSLTGGFGGLGGFFTGGSSGGSGGSLTGGSLFGLGGFRSERRATFGNRVSFIITVLMALDVWCYLELIRAARRSNSFFVSLTVSST